MSRPLLQTTDTSQTVVEMLLLRKLRRAQPGIELERFNRGEEKQPRDDLGVDQYGLQSHAGEKDEWVRIVLEWTSAESSFATEQERMKRMVRSNNFTQQTNALDVDKHMIDYIETEFAKRRGLAVEKEKEVEHDPQAELFK